MLEEVKNRNASNETEKLILHQLHILDVQMLSSETRNERKKTDNVVRTFN